MTVAQALALYTAFLNEQIARTKPAFRNRAVIIITLPDGGFLQFSYQQMLSQVQMRTPLGTNQAILHARARGYVV